jgi:hypothetical protein
VLARPILGWRRFYSLHTIALSSRGNIAVVALFASAPWLDREGCCVRRLHSYGHVNEPILLWAIPLSGRFRPIRDPFMVLAHSFSAQ